MTQSKTAAFMAWFTEAEHLRKFALWNIWIWFVQFTVLVPTLVLRVSSNLEPLRRFLPGRNQHHGAVAFRSGVVAVDSRRRTSD